MEYVMVPVPEALTEDVEHFLMETDMRARAADRAVEIDPASVSGDDPGAQRACRALFLMLSEAALPEQGTRRSASSRSDAAERSTRRWASCTS